MNAAPPVLQAQPLNDAIQPSAPGTAAAATARGASRDFASALNDAGGKPARKNAANKHPDPTRSGSPLPAPGNQPPLASTPPPPAKTDASAAVSADAAAIVKGSPGSAQGSAPSAIAAASTAPANSSGVTTTLTSGNLDPAAAPAAPAAPAVAAQAAVVAPPDIAASSAPAAGANATVIGSGPTMPHAVSLRTLATPGTSTAAAAAAVPTGNTGSAKLRDTPATLRPIATANSASSSTDSNAVVDDSTASNGSAAAGADAQAVMAAAIVQGTSAPPPDASSSDNLAIPDTGVAQSAAAPSDPTAGTPAAALAHAAAASISAAVTAATAASVHALSDAAGVSAADKRSHVDSPDAVLPGVSNDGSAGAAQLLTSNTSPDGVPMPSFKVAAGVDTAQFGQGVADHVALMMDGNLTSAKLQVNPPALGPIEVRIALQGGHAQVSFSSHSAVTRDALESSSEKLREMLGSQGFSQVSVDISQRSFQERSPQSQAYQSAPAISADAPVLALSPQSMPRSASGLLDAYA